MKYYTCSLETGSQRDIVVKTSELVKHHSMNYISHITANLNKLRLLNLMIDGTANNVWEDSKPKTH